jgi:hypothetical protein
MRPTLYYFFEACRFKCSCHPYRHGQVIHAIGPQIGDVMAWACLRCLQAHLTFFELTADESRLVQTHDESFHCINDLPECFQFSYLDFDNEDGRPMGWDSEWTQEDDERVAKMRHTLDLPPLDDSGYERLSDALIRRLQ